MGRLALIAGIVVAAGALAVLALGRRASAGLPARRGEALGGPTIRWIALVVLLLTIAVVSVGAMGDGPAVAF